MKNLFKKILGDKKVWKEIEARAKTLPMDYQVVYEEIKPYMWKKGVASIDVFEGVLGLFEEGVVNGRNVLEITGSDVATFCDELLPQAKTYSDKWHDALNSDIAKKLHK